MSELFTLYRYLVRSQDRRNDDNQYNQALRALEPVLDLITELEAWGKNIEEGGGIDWDDAQTITDRIAAGHRAALCAFADGAANAIIVFAAEALPLQGYDRVIEVLKEQQEKEKKLEEEISKIGDLDDHPF